MRLQPHARTPYQELRLRYLVIVSLDYELVPWRSRSVGVDHQKTVNLENHASSRDAISEVVELGNEIPKDYSRQSEGGSTCNRSETSCYIDDPI